MKATAHITCLELRPRDVHSGRFSATVSLPKGRRYRYRFLVDDERWENDRAADTYVPNVFGTDDSVVEL